MSIQSKTRNWYYREPRVTDREYETALCTKCAGLVVGGNYCANCGTVEAVMVPELQVGAFQATFAMVQGLQAAVAIVRDPEFQPTVTEMEKLTAEHLDWLDEVNTRESDRPL